MKLFSQDPKAAIIRDINEVDVSDIPKGKIAQQIEDDLKSMHEYALFAAEIYERPELKFENEGKFETYKLSQRLAGWERYELPDLPKTPKWKYRVNGLGCEVWVKQRTRARHLAVIVFRGTDVTEIGDWISNVRWLRRALPLRYLLWPLNFFIWDEYDQTRELIPSLVENIQRDYGDDVTIIATGHSLGGGLAQLAGYASKRVRVVYAFDPSPVTAYYDIPKANRDANKVGMRIYRIYERGEILHYLRGILKAVYPVSYKDPKIVEVKYNLIELENKIDLDACVHRHNMRKLAEKLWYIAANCGAENQVEFNPALQSGKHVDEVG